MKGDGHPPDSSTSPVDWSDTGFRPSTEPIDTEARDRDQYEVVSTGGSVDQQDVDDLEAQLEQRDADLQQVIDRYEAVLEDQSDVPTDRTDPRGGSTPLVGTLRARLGTFVTDIEQSLRRGRE